MLGTVLLSNQEFSIDVKKKNTSVLSNNSAQNNALATDAMRVVINNFGNYFIYILPDVP